MARLVRHRQPKGPEPDMPSLTPPRHISTLREAGMKLIREPVEPRTSPVVTLKLSHGKYKSWGAFLDNAYWSVELE
jgi:hypothetical protein